jgi:prevent-host-death family protein
METVGIRELKAHLSHYLSRVRDGVRVTVTDRGRAVATLVPVDAPAAAEWAHRMVAAGHAQWSGGKPSGLARRIPARGTPASRMVIEDRR